MAEYYRCAAHGHMLTTAIDAKGKFVKLPEALKNQDEKYYCPSPECGVRVVPEGGTAVIAGNYWRKGHFNAVPGISERSPARKESLAALVREAVAADLRYSGDFDVVETDVKFVSRVNGKKGWHDFRRFPVDIFARRTGGYGLDVMLHVWELSGCSAGEIYHKLKQGADEQSARAKRKFVIKDGKETELERRVYQNVIVVKNEHSYSEGDDGVVIVPKIYSFLGCLTNDILYFDPESVKLFSASFSNPRAVEGAHENDTRRVFDVSTREIPYFSFHGKDRGRVERWLANKSGRSMHIPHWKLAVAAEVDVDADGSPVSVARKGGQRQMIFK